MKPEMIAEFNRINRESVRISIASIVISVFVIVAMVAKLLF